MKFQKVDQRGKKGQFILTGSATPDRKGIMHSGAGRISTLRMRPMSLYESRDSSGQISLYTIITREYLDAIINDDIYRLEGINRNTRKMNLLLKSLASMKALQFP